MVRNYVKKRAPYDEEAMQNAIKAVRSGSMGYMKAANTFGVKRETLRDQVRKRYQKMGPGRDTYLSAAEENEIEECLKLMARWGFGFSQTEVLQLVGEYARSKPNNPFKSSLPSHEWLYGFFKRHPNLTRRLPEQLKSARAKTSANESIVKEWFELVEQTLKEHHLQDCPHRIFNVDETGMPLDPKRIRVICEKNISHLFRVIGGSGRDSITVNGCASADGKMLPPYVIYAAKNLRSTWTENGPQECRYTVSDKGWMDSTCLLDWFEKLFIPSITKERPVVLIFDGHKSHISVPLIQSAVKNNIILLKLPPNSTHALQPLDVGVYGPLKTAWEKILISFARQNLGAALTKELFPSLLNKLWISGCLSEANIKSGFARCGIFPLNPNAVPRSLYESSEIFDRPAPTDTGRSSFDAAEPSSASATVPSFTINAGPSSSEATWSSSANNIGSSSSETAGQSQSSSSTPESSRPETPSSSVQSPAPSIKDYFLQKISPMLQAKREQNTRKKTVRRKYGESLTSMEYIKRMTEEEEEKKSKKGKRKGKRTVNVNARGKATKKQKLVNSDSDADFGDSDVDDERDEDWIPQRRRPCNDSDSDSDNDLSSQTERNVFETFM